MISSLSAGGITVNFNVYKVPIRKSGKYKYCKKPVTRITTFEMYRSIFNTNPD